MQPGPPLTFIPAEQFAELSISTPLVKCHMAMELNSTKFVHQRQSSKDRLVLLLLLLVPVCPMHVFQVSQQ